MGHQKLSGHQGSSLSQRSEMGGSCLLSDPVGIAAPCLIAWAPSHLPFPPQPLLYLTRLGENSGVGGQRPLQRVNSKPMRQRPQEECVCCAFDIQPTQNPSVSACPPPNSAIAGGIWGTVDLSDVGCPDSAGMLTLFYPAPEHPASISRLGRAPTLLFDPILPEPSPGRADCPREKGPRDLCPPELGPTQHQG